MREQNQSPNRKAIWKLFSSELPEPSQLVNVLIINTTRIQVRPENRNEFLQTVCPLLEPIRNEKGCMAYRIFVDATDENSSLLVGEWQTQEDWSNHLKSNDFAVLMGAITVLGSPNCIELRLLSSVPSLPEPCQPAVRRTDNVYFFSKE